MSKVGRSFTLSRSKSIASARDRWKLSSSYGLLPFLGKEKQEKEEEKALETERLKEALTVESGQRIRLERELVAARQEGRQQNEELAELREEQREIMGAETRQDDCLSSHIIFSSFYLIDSNFDCFSSPDVSWTRTRLLSGCCTRPWQGSTRWPRRSGGRSAGSVRR